MNYFEQYSMQYNTDETAMRKRIPWQNEILTNYKFL